MQNLLEADHGLWSRLMALRGDTKRNILVLVQGDQIEALPLEDQSTPADSLTLEPGQVIVEVTGLDEAARTRAVDSSGTADWQLRESKIMRKPARVIPRDEKTVLVMDDPGDPYTMSQEDPRGVGFDGVDQAA